MSASKNSKKNKRTEDEPEATSAVVEPENEGNVEEDEDEEGDLALDELDLPESVLKRVKGLRKLHDSYEAIDKEYKEQRVALEKQFLERKRTLYSQRQLVVTGQSDINEEGELNNEAPKDENPEEKGVPSFWLTVLSSHGLIGSLITQEDVPALEAITNISVEYNDDFSEFTLFFHFAANDFFSNEVLTKKYIVDPDILDDRSPALSEIKGTEIQWKTGKNLNVKEITKKQKAKGGRNKGQVRTVTRTVPKPSFFHFFDEPTAPVDEEDEQEEPEDEESGLGRTKFNLDEDYDIGHIIRTSIIPEAILYFTGEAEDDGMYGDDDEDDDEDEDGEGGDEEDEEEEEEAAPKDDKKKKNKGNAAAANSGEKPPECKQN